MRDLKKGPLRSLKIMGGEGGVHASPPAIPVPTPL